MPLRLVFMGSPDFAVPTLRAVITAGHDVACIYSQPPRPAGRGQALRPTPVHAEADARGMEVRTPKNFRDPADREAFAALKVDAAVVVAYGLLLPLPVLEAPRLGCFNLHGSLLPRWRGAAPIHRAVMAGDNETGVQVMRMEEGLDTGPVMLTARTPISAIDTTGDVHDRLAVLGADLMVEALALLESGKAEFVAQEAGSATYATKISSAEARIDWTRPAREVSAHIRGLSPHPGAWFEAQTEGGQARIKALRAVEASGDLPGAAGDGSGVAPGRVMDDGLLVACGEGAVRLTRLQRAGKGPMDADTFLRGAPLRKGAVLT